MTTSTDSGAPAAPARLALPRLSDRRLRLLARAGMGGRGRRRHRRGQPAWPGSTTYCAHGTGRTEAILLRHAHRAAHDPERLRSPRRPRPRHRTRRANAAAKRPTTAPPSPPPRHPGRRPPLPQAPPYPVAVGALAGAHGIDEDATIAAALQAFAANLISAAVRLVPLGQSAGLRVLAALEPTIRHVTDATRIAAPGRHRRLRLPLRPRRHAPRNPVHEAVPLMTHPTRPAPRRHRRPGRLRQDRADGRAVQAVPRPLRHRRHHQRHLHQGGRGVPDPRRLAAARTHPGDRDRRLPAHRDPRGRLDQPRRRRRAAAALPRRST